MVEKIVIFATVFFSKKKPDKVYSPKNLINRKVERSN
jgi:hypothetical protein